jgi:glycosyltransferase involved in cell wall biosynthesis
VHRNIRFIRYLAEFGWSITALTAHEIDVRRGRRGEPFDQSLLTRIPLSVRIERTHVPRAVPSLLRLRTLLGSRDTRSRGETHERARRAPEQGRPPLSPLQRGKDFLSTLLCLPDPDVGWLPSALLRGFRVIRRDGLCALYTSGPPHSCHLVGWGLKRLTGLPWVADFRDPWSRPPSIDPAARETWHHRVNMILERRVVHSADRVVLNTESARAEFAGHYAGLPAERFVAILNGYDPDDFVGLRERPPINDTFVMTHGGSFYRERTPYGLLVALSELIQEQRVRLDAVRLRFLGRCALGEVREDVKALGLEPCVEWVGPIPHRDCLEALAASDLLLLFQPGLRIQVPMKLFEYMATKRPILSLAEPEGSTAVIIRDYRLGEVLDPGDIKGIKEAIVRFYNTWSRHGAVPANDGRAPEAFHARTLTRALERVLTEALEGTAR